MDTDPGMQRVKKTWLRFVFSSQKTREEGMQNNLSNTHKKNKGKSNKISSKWCDKIRSELQNNHEEAKYDNKMITME